MYNQILRKHKEILLLITESNFSKETEENKKLEIWSKFNIKI